jgi:hypothetical protein
VHRLLKSLQVTGNFLELVDRAPVLARQGTGDSLKAMVEVIAYEGLFSFVDGLFDGMELLGDVNAGSARLDHLDDAAQVTAGTFQPFDNLGMRLMKVHFVSHGP